MPFQQRVAEVLAAWRLAERRRDALPEGSLERATAEAEVAELHTEYQRVVELQLRQIDHPDDRTAP